MSNNVWFTGDHHFGHPKMNQPGYASRGFDTVEAMDAAMIQAWVARVKPGDRVYHLGDFCFTKDPERYLDQLPGQMYLIIGNHDRNRTVNHPRWIWAREAAYFPITLPSGERQKVHLSHYAFETWRSSHHGSWHLHGHSHGNLRPRGRRIDVGVDNPYAKVFQMHPPGLLGIPPIDRRRYAPWSVAEVAAMMAKLRFEQVDHHAERPPNPDRR